jgi:hypothetical protein
MKLLSAAASLGLLSSACGGKVLDLGISEGPRYATPETIRAAEDAGINHPIVMAAHQYGALELALDETRLYWTTGRTPPLLSQEVTETNVVRSCAKTDCAATVITYAAHVRRKSIAINKSHVYWIAAPPGCCTGSPAQPPTCDGLCPTVDLVACLPQGCEVGGPVVIAPRITPTNLVADDTHVYWTSSDATVLRCPADGCVTRPELVALTQEVVTGAGTLTLDDERVFWTIRRANQATGAVMTAPKDGSGTATILVDNLHMPMSIAVDRTNVYWTEAYSIGAIKTCGLTGCAGEPSVIAAQQPYAGYLKVLNGAAYWFAPEDGSPRFLDGHDPIPGSLLACPVTGCVSAPTVLVSHQLGPGAIAVDATHIYWTSYGEAKRVQDRLYFDGDVKRMRRQEWH